MQKITPSSSINIFNLNMIDNDVVNMKGDQIYMVANQTPELIVPIVDQAVKYGTVGWNYDVSTSFDDKDASDSLSYAAMLANGDPLPAWIQINANTGLVTGLPGFDDRGTYPLHVIATDSQGSSVSAPWTVAVTAFDAGKLLVSTAGNDSLAGTLANDTVTYAYATAPVAVSLSITTQQDTSGSGLDTLTNINNLIGSNYNDNLVGDLKNNFLDGGIGADTLVGGSGNDGYIIDNISDVINEKFNGGIDTVSSSLTYKLPNNVEDLSLIGASNINGTGNSLANLITGNASINKINGGAGADTMAGGLGNDIYFIDNAGDIITENLNEGIDKVNSNVTYTLPDNVENLTLTGTLAINATGNGAANIIIGNTASNQLIGGAGNDILNGGAGNNTLTGEAGKDYFQFKTADHITAGSIDTITDYNIVDDTIKLSKSVFTVFTNPIPSPISASQFVIGSKALDADDFIIYNDTTGKLLYDADGSGSDAAVQFAIVGTGLAMTNADFHVI